MHFFVCFCFLEKKKRLIEKAEQAVKDFYISFNKTVYELKIKHHEELFELYTKKKAYATLVKDQGQEEVDKKIHLSHIQSQRNAAIKYGVPVQTSQWLQLDQVALGHEYSIDNDELASLTGVSRTNSARSLLTDTGKIN